MPRPKKTEAEIQATREKILNTTLTILEESGPEAVTSRAIAKRLGMAHMSLFTYFKNQADIWAALREQVISEFRAPLNKIEMRSQSENIPSLVKEIWAHIITFAKEKPYLHRLTWVMPEMEGVKFQANHQETRAVIDQIAGILKLGMEQGNFEERDPRLTAITMMGMINLPFIMFHSGKLVDPAIRDRIIDEMYTALMLYLENKR